MIKIRNHTQLHEEKQRLKKRQNELEQKINHYFESVKDNLHPLNLAAHLLANALHSTKTTDRYQSISEKTGKILGQLIKIAIEKLEEKIGTWLAKK